MESQYYIEKARKFISERKSKNVLHMVLNMDDKDAVFQIGVMLRENGKYKEAAEIFQIVLNDKFIKENKFMHNKVLNEYEIALKKTVLKSKPVRMHVVVTTACNLKCIMCRVRKETYTMDDTVFNIITENLPFLENIMWQGGEVLVYKRFYEIIEMAAKYNVRQTFLTNGLLLDKKTLDLIVNHDMIMIISIDSPRKEVYEKIRVGAKFADLLEVLGEIREHKKRKPDFNYSMAVVMMSLNYDQIEEIIEFAVLYGFSSVYFQKYMADLGDDVLIPDSKQQRIINEKLRYFHKKSEDKEIPLRIVTNINIDDEPASSVTFLSDSENNSNTDKNTPVHEKEKKKVNSKKTGDGRLFCVAPWKTLFLDYNHTIRFSCYCAPLSMDMSGIQRSDDIWNSDGIVKYRKSIINGNLYDCCSGLCKNAGDDGIEVRK
ncbi:MAG: radical SAM/SPASM domain-containing protein [Endomicrobiaceae bacterium]